MEQTFHYLLMSNYTNFQKKLLEMVKSFGLTTGQPKVLDYLKDYDGASQKEIAKACGIEAGSLTSVLNRMEEKNMIERRTLNGNRRTFHIFLTPLGKELQEKVAQAFSSLEAQALDGFSEDEYRLFMKLFLNISKNIKGGQE